jgi:succinate dehydrogenase / fumarate reductase iron-sulfur subunit
MKVVLKIMRFNSENEKGHYFQEFTIEQDSSRRVLDALLYIKRCHDSSLAVRKSCAHGVCGSDAMRINGVECLACKTLIRDVAERDGDVITIEPLKNFQVQRDLMVDQKPFFEKFKKTDPFLKPKAPPKEKEYIQSQKEREAIDDPTKCILCGACYSACSILESNDKFLGPAALVQGIRFVNDSRDEGLDERMHILDTPDGVWACENHFACTKVCPRGIKVTKLINQTKRQIKKKKEEDK